jgi:hypothetical protein
METKNVLFSLVREPLERFRYLFKDSIVPDDNLAEIILESSNRFRAEISEESEWKYWFLCSVDIRTNSLKTSTPFQCLRIEVFNKGM